MRMSVDKIKIIGLFLLFSSGVILPNLIISTGFTKDSPSISSSFEEGQISIVGKDDWNSSGWSGNGTETSTYLVENLTLTLFNIDSSDVFFRVQNCICEVPADLYLVSNGTIVNCTFIDSVTLDSCRRMQFTNNTFRPDELVGYTRVALTILDSDAISIEDCQIENWQPYGIKIDVSTNCILQNNTFSECGIFVLIITPTMQIGSLSSLPSKSFGAAIDPIPNGGGLFMDTCMFCKVLNNSFIDNIGYGFSNLDSVDTIICDNLDINNGLRPSLLRCNNNLVMNNSLSSLTLYTSINCTLYLNRLESSGLYISGYLSNYVHNVTQNTVAGKPLLYLLNERDTNYDNAEFGQVFIVNSTQVVLNNNQVSTVINIIYSNMCNVTEVSCSAISVIYSTRSDIGYSEIIGGLTGIYCRESVETLIHHNTVINTGQGISISYESENCIVHSNQIVDARNNGISIEKESNMCRVENNTITGSAITQYDEHGGIFFYYAGIMIRSHNCTILNNTVTDNQGYGILVSGYNNTIFLNFLARNEEGNGLSNGNGNYWDNGIDTGNYWDDWSGSGVYTIPGSEGSVDRFPNGSNGTSNDGLPITTMILLLISGTSAVVVVLALILVIRSRKSST